jgi:bile acid:Na+ symporter, BASS family
MLAYLTSIAVPSIVLLLMLVAGLELRIEDFRRVRQYPRTVVIAIAGQVLLLPLLAIGLVQIGTPPKTLSSAMILLAMSPGGAISNYYCYLARQNVALSVTLTAINTLVSLISIPLWAAACAEWLGVDGSVTHTPIASILAQLVSFILAPTIVGMWLGEKFQAQVRNWKAWLAMGSLFLVALLLAASIWAVREVFVSTFTETVTFAILFTLGATLLGKLVARAVSTQDRHVVTIESAVRNIPIAILVGGSMATEPAFVGFAASYLLVEAAVMIPYAMIVRALAKSSPRPPLLIG